MTWKNEIQMCFGLADRRFAGHPSDQQRAYKVICPMFATGLEIDADTISGIVRAIRWGEIEKGGLPHTIDHGVGHSPEVKISWSRSTSDLVCLAHEVAHAVQLRPILHVSGEFHSKPKETLPLRPSSQLIVRCHHMD